MFNPPIHKRKFVLALLVIPLFLLSASLLSLSFPAAAAPAFQLTPFPTPTPLPDGRILYTVQPNDTLLRISLISGVPVDEIRALNNFTGDNITAGQVLLLGLAGPQQVTPTAGPNPTATPLLPTPTPKPGAGEICVLLFQDLNGDAIRQADSGEAPLEGAISVGNRSGSVSLAETEGEEDLDPQTGITLSDSICFKQLPEGSYSVTVGVPDQYNPTTVTNYELILNSGDKTYVDFGAQMNSEAEAEEETPAGNTWRPILGIVGVVLLLAGAGLGLVAGRMLSGK